MNVGRLNVSKKIFPLTVYSINFPNLPYKYIYIIINYNKSWEFQKVIHFFFPFLHLWNRFFNNLKKEILFDWTALSLREYTKS